jgi:PAS domain S-box-containing protein
MRHFWNRETSLWVFLAIAVLLTAAVGRYNVGRMESSEQVLQSTRTTHAELTALLADVVEAETGHRGYILTGKDEYLEPFRQADTRVWDRIKRIREQVAENPRQLERMANAEKLIHEKYAEMHRTIVVHDTEGRVLAAAGIAEGRGKRTMDDFRIVMRELLASEEERMEQRGDATDAQYRIAKFTNILAAILSISILLSLGILTRRHEWRRSRLTDKLAESKKETDDALARLDAFLRHAPYGIAYLDPDLRFIRVNESLAREHGVPIRDHVGHRLTELLPHFPPDLLDDYRKVLETEHGFIQRLVHGAGLVWELTAFAVPDAGGRRGLGVIGLNVTDRHRQEEQIRQSEARFRTLTEAMPQIVWTANADGAVEYFNTRFYEFTGQSVETGLGWAWGSILHPDDLERTMAQWTDALRLCTSFESEHRLRRHDGVYEWFLTRALPVFNDTGTLIRWLGTSTGVDEQMRISQALRDERSQLKQLTDGVPFLMWACLPTGECDYLSRQWVEFTGVPEVEQLPYGWLEVLHPDDRAGTAEAWQAATERKNEYDVEFRIRRHDGVHRWFAVRGIPLRDEHGHIVRWYGSCVDIDDRKRQATTLEKMVIERTASLHRMNSALREQQIFLDAILNNVAEGIVACDAEGKLKLFNAATMKLHGLPMEPLPHEQWIDHYRLYESDGVAPMPPNRVPLLRAWRGEVVQDAELLIRTPDGADRYVLCSGVQLQAADGTTFGAVVSMRDMTERREYERQLVVTAAALEQAIDAYRLSNTALLASNAELEKFAYIASHDLQEPLRKIQAFGTRLAGKHRDLLDVQGKDYINRMLDSAGRMSKLIEDLLAFSRVGTKTLPMEAVNLNSVVGDVLKDLELRVQQSGGQVQVGPLPSVKGDASQLRQVFQNLIGNALKFARVGVTPVVKVLAVPFQELGPDSDPPQPAGGGWRFTVEDNGIGFEQGYAERIFELFQRLHARFEYEGTGLGLAIVRKIVLRHGAAITARGKPGEGATFVIDWPLRATNPS